MLSRHITIGLILAVTLAAPAGVQTVMYVDANADQTPHDGSDWCRAYLELYEALAAPGADTVIRVADGTYLPDTSGLGDPREATFQLANGATIEGGYAGCGAPDPDERDIALYETILSGDLLGDDGPGWVNRGDNSYHVVTGSGRDATAVLDGFTITGGNANGAELHAWGGGMHTVGGDSIIRNCTFSDNQGTSGGGMSNSSNSSPTLTGCMFSGNSATNSGGGMRNSSNSTPTLTGCTFSGNSTTSGGGMYNNDSSPTLTNCTFAGNSATLGAGGMFSQESSPTLTNCAFIANSAVDWAGGMYNRDSSPTLTNCTFIANSTDGEGGGMYIDLSSSTLINCIFSGNSAETGGGMYIWYDSTVTLTNCTFATNSAVNGKAMACDSHDPPKGPYPNTLEMNNCILWDGGDEIWNDDDSTITITYSDVQDGWVGEGNISIDPLFGSDFRLMPGSPCIDAANNAAVPPVVVTDLHGLPRFYDDPATPDTGLGDPPIVDMGIYEFQVAPVPGDMNGDWVVNGDDIGLFIQALLNP